MKIRNIQRVKQNGDYFEYEGKTWDLRKFWGAGKSIPGWSLMYGDNLFTAVIVRPIDEEIEVGRYVDGPAEVEAFKFEGLL